MYTNIEKTNISNKVQQKLTDLNMSQNEAAKKLKISSATFSLIVTGTWNEKKDTHPVSQQMWTKIAKWIGYNQNWKIASTRNYKVINSLCFHAQEKGISKAIAANPGCGKSQALRDYSLNHKNAYYIECEEYWTRKVFLQKLSSVFGIDSTGMTTHEMVDHIIRVLSNMDKPLLIVDEADKLSDNGINIYKTLYNKTNGGFVLAGAPYFRKRIERGCARHLQSYQEIYSRLGGEFIGMSNVDQEMVKDVCAENGITNQEDVQSIYNRSNGDLRRVKNDVERIKLATLINE